MCEEQSPYRLLAPIYTYLVSATYFLYAYGDYLIDGKIAIFSLKYLVISLVGNIISLIVLILGWWILSYVIDLFYSFTESRAKKKK